MIRGYIVKFKNMTVLASMVLLYSAQGMARQYDAAASGFALSNPKATFLLVGAGGAGGAGGQGGAGGAFGGQGGQGG